MLHAVLDLVAYCVTAYVALGRLAAAVVRARARRDTDRSLAARFGPPPRISR